jgi:hypothetical protein
MLQIAAYGDIHPKSCASVTHLMQKTCFNYVGDKSKMGRPVAKSRPPFRFLTVKSGQQKARHIHGHAGRNPVAPGKQESAPAWLLYPSRPSLLHPQLAGGMATGRHEEDRHLKGHLSTWLGMQVGSAFRKFEAKRHKPRHNTMKNNSLLSYLQ